MKKRILIVLCGALVTYALQAAPTGAEALRDWKNLAALAGQVGETAKIFTITVVYEKPEERLAELESFEKKELAKITPVLDMFRKKYGSTAVEIDNTLRPLTMGMDTPDQSAGYLYEDLDKAVKGAAALRKNMGGKLLKDAEQQMDSAKDMEESIRVGEFDQAKKVLELAARYDPANAAVKDKLANMGVLQKGMAAEIEKARDARTWPASGKDFAGPGSPSTLVAASRKFLTTDKHWSKGKLVAVCINGNWWSVEKNIFGVTTMWGLPVLAAFEIPNDKENVRVFGLSMLNMEGKQKPPFTAASVGDNYIMRRAKVKDGGGSFIGGLIGFLWRVLLAGLNILAGLLAAAPLLTVMVPQLKAVYGRLTPFRNLVGVAALMMGLVAFLLCLVTFHPLSSVLPQVSAIAAGLFLGKGLLLKKPALAPAGAASGAAQKAQAAVDKMQELYAKHQDKVALLEEFQVPIGLACLALGVLHLLIGGVVLF